jgi:hypothetical protein
MALVCFGLNNWLNHANIISVKVSECRLTFVRYPNGGRQRTPFFDFDWKSQRWNLLVVLGAMIGGFVAVNFMSPSNVAINPDTIEQLATYGIDALMVN